jgi:hypothetical protein
MAIVGAAALAAAGRSDSTVVATEPAGPAVPSASAITAICDAKSPPAERLPPRPTSTGADAGTPFAATLVDHRGDGALAVRAEASDSLFVAHCAVERRGDRWVFVDRGASEFRGPETLPAPAPLSLRQAHFSVMGGYQLVYGVASADVVAVSVAQVGGPVSAVVDSGVFAAIVPAVGLVPADEVQVTLRNAAGEEAVFPVRNSVRSAKVGDPSVTGRVTGPLAQRPLSDDPLPLVSGEAVDAAGHRLRVVSSIAEGKELSITLVGDPGSSGVAGSPTVPLMLAASGNATTPAYPPTIFGATRREVATLEVSTKLGTVRAATFTVDGLPQVRLFAVDVAGVVDTSAGVLQQVVAVRAFDEKGVAVLSER